MTRRPRAFTLVEMMIAIGIIVVLTAITVSASVALGQKSEVRRTQGLLTSLDLALQEWELETGRQLTWGDDGMPANAVYDLSNDTPHVFTISEALRRIRRSERVKPILAQIPPKLLYTYDSTEGPPPEWLPTVVDADDPDANAGLALGAYQGGDWDNELAVLDAWGMPIRVVHPGRLASDFFGDTLPADDADGTIYLEAGSTYGTEEFYGRALNRKVLFVSAGPDRKFGNLDAPPETPLHKQAEDNVTSYAIVDEH